MGRKRRVARCQHVAVQGLLEADVVGGLDRIGRHHIGDLDAGQRLADQAPGFFGTRRAQEEPAEEYCPDAADQAPRGEEGDQTVGDEQEREGHANAGGDPGGSQAIMGAQPDQRLQDPAAVQRERG